MKVMWMWPLSWKSQDSLILLTQITENLESGNTDKGVEATVLVLPFTNYMDWNIVLCSFWNWFRDGFEASGFT
jgi:hypothetical protein